MPNGTTPPRFDLLTANPVHKPFRYPWAYDAWLTQQRVHCRTWAARRMSGVRRFPCRLG